MLYEISNETLSLIVSTKACEMHSLKRKDDDYEYLWNGDERYWKGRNPILFPQVSSTSNKINTINGKEYPMGNHGFARNSEFELVEQNDNSLTFLLKENEETLKQYPYHFNLFVNYTLKENSVVISYEIKNTDVNELPFGFGLHPAFNASDDFKDSTIVFDDETKLELSNELFKEYPTYFVKPTPKKALLTSNNHQISLEFKKFKYLAIWSPFAPFVCIEPWLILDCKDGVDFTQREDTIILKPNESYKIDYKINVLGKIK